MAKSKRQHKRESQAREELQKKEAMDIYDISLKKSKIKKGSFSRDLKWFCESNLDSSRYPNYGVEPSKSHILPFVSAMSSVKGKPECRKALIRLIDACEKSKLITHKPVGVEYLTVLSEFAKWENMWLREPGEWVPKTHNANRQLSSLMRFLFCKYEIPSFMDGAWLKSKGSNLFHEQEWFINLGRGENIRKQDGLPFTLTKKMAHHFLEAPSNYSIKQAFRWGQIKAMGGDRRVVEGVMQCPLGNSFEHNAFWTTVIQFFIDNPMLDANQYRNIYDYLYNQKFVYRGHVYIDNVLVNQGPEQPNLSMHGRNPMTLINQVEKWHGELSRQSKRRNNYTAWSSCGIKGFFKESKDETVHIIELLDSKQLDLEGKLMHHCVGSYTNSCSTGLCAIYSLRKDHKINGHSVEATIEVGIKSREIVQARKKYNKNLTNSDWNVIERWASEENLRISSWIK